MLLNAYSIMHEMREQALIGFEARMAFVAYYLYDVRNNMQNVHTQGAHTQCISQTLPIRVAGGSQLPLISSKSFWAGRKAKVLPPPPTE